MADEETAVAEPKEPVSPPAEAPPVTPEPVEAVPAPEQEQPKPEGEDASGTPAAEDEAPTLEQAREANLAQIEEWAEGDPAALAQLVAKYGETSEDVQQQKLELESDTSQKTRKENWDTSLTQYQQAPQVAEQQIGELLGRLNPQLLKAAEDLEKGVEGATAAGVQFNAQGVARMIAPMVQQAQSTAINMAASAARQEVATGLMQSPGHAYLTAEERTQFHDSINSGEFAKAITLQEKALAERGLDPEARKAAKAEADKEAGLIEKATKFSLGIGKNGKPSGSAPAKKQNDDELLSDPNTPLDVVEKILARQDNEEGVNHGFRSNNLWVASRCASLDHRTGTDCPRT